MAVNALLSIILAGLTSGLVGFLISTIVITIFGEILPQAICSRNALQIGSRVIPLVRVIMFLLLPLTWPLAKSLDWLLGDEIGTIHTKTELRELMSIHVDHGAVDLETGRELQGVLKYREIKVSVPVALARPSPKTLHR